MSKGALPDWEKYWANFNDLGLLKSKSANLDETLQLIEKEFATKLLSGDHMQILDALEDRLAELERMEKAQAVQSDLFENLTNNSVH
ncbi:hypothetical protein JXA02_01310 [candidate division KSB1 bacterium]|nr:hypothetical protein [candidate division KSB1 bacterium]RQW11019.1 MAG: hypothetical protein EH222_01420 [candidate division KSB1 bacterium]